MAKDLEVDFSLPIPEDLSDDDCELVAASDVDDLFVLEKRNWADGDALLAVAEAKAALVALAPAVEAAVLVESHYVGGADGDVDDVFVLDHGEGRGVLDEVVEFGLFVLALAPGKERSVLDRHAADGVSAGEVHQLVVVEVEVHPLWL